MRSRRARPPLFARRCFASKQPKPSKEAFILLSRSSALGADGSNRRRRPQSAPGPGSRAPRESTSRGRHLISSRAGRASIHFKVDPVEREIKATTTDAIGRCFNLWHQSERASPPRLPPPARPARRMQRLNCSSRWEREAKRDASSAATLSAPVRQTRGHAPRRSSPRPAAAAPNACAN